MKKFNSTPVSILLMCSTLIAVISSGLTDITSAQAADSRNQSIDEAQGCVPQGEMWVNGPLKPEIATQVQQALEKVGVTAVVEARSYGEMDSCQTYTQQGIDFTITPAQTDLNAESTVVTNELLPILEKFGKPNLGNVTLINANGENIRVDAHPNSLQTVQADAIPEGAVFKNVYVIVYDPILSNGQRLSEYKQWNSHATITQETIDFFKQASNNKLNYTVVSTAIVNQWPQKTDGFSYTEASYLAVSSGQQTAHSPDEVDYNKIVNSPSLDICGKLNRGEIDEVWIYNAPWFGFYESRLAGPGAYYLNSPPVSGANQCNRLVPLMGPSVERATTEAVHNFGHRSESIMAQVYGGWQQNSTSHNWNKFGLVKAQSPSYTYSGCGSVHYPPNGVSDYDYSNGASKLSNCDDFANYPNLSNALQVAKPVTCAKWNCTQLGYLNYWFNHFPVNPGCGPDGFSNDWWTYLVNPAAALHPSNTCLPYVQTTKPAGPTPTNAGQISFLVNFSEAVTGVSADDFALTTSGGVQGAAVSNVTGTGANYTVTVKSGTGNGTIRLDVLNNSSIRNKTNHPLLKAFKNGKVYTLINRDFTTLSISSVAAQDGWILETGENRNTGGTFNASATTFQLGDDKFNRQYRTILSFNTAALPDTAGIISAVLKIKQSGATVGKNPFNVLGVLWADIHTSPFGAAALELSDFSAAASANQAGSFNKTALNGWYTNTLSISGRNNINKTGITQFRLYFATDDNNDHIADYINFLSGNALADKPTLTIVYIPIVTNNDTKP